MVKTKAELREIESSVQTALSAAITHEDIERRAYALYEARGREDGRALDDWLQAERELLDAHKNVLRDLENEGR
jgi:outer membrane protein TolC